MAYTLPGYMTNKIRVHIFLSGGMLYTHSLSDLPAQTIQDLAISAKHFLESLILAQDERWRRA